METHATRKTERLLDLLVLLLGSRRPLQFSEIREQFPEYRTPKRESGARTFERDKKELLLLGAPLRCVPKGTFFSGEELEEDAYIVDSSQYLLPDIDLDPEELAALALIADVARTESAFPYRQEVESALAKITFDRESPKAPAELRFDLRTAGVTRILVRHLAALEGAVRNRKRVEARYRKVGERSATARTLDPYGLVYQHGSWLLVAHCHSRGAPRTFRVDRIASVKVAGKPLQPDFERPPNLDVRALALRSPWTFQVEPPVLTILEASAAVSYLAREDFGTGALHYELPGGATRIEFPCGNPAYVVARVLAAAGHLRVIAPAPLRARVRTAARANLEVYR